MGQNKIIRNLLKLVKTNTFEMKAFLSSILLLFFFNSFVIGDSLPKNKIRVLVITGNHSYNKETFNAMFESIGNSISFQVVEFPVAYEMFLPENRNKFDVLVFYHMWQKISVEQKKVFADCISEGKPVVALHHSICAYDDWEEYWRIIGGKYFHKTTILDGKEYKACTYIHDMHFVAHVVDKNNPVSKGVSDFDLFDETYKGYWVDPGVKLLLTTNDTTSTPVIGWTKTYGKSRIVTLQSGHDSPTFENPNFRQLLKQSIEWVNEGIKK
jgi:type 1 glutamine amidotransferase